MPRHLVWFSCGAASAVAAHLAVKKYPECEVLYCDTLAYEHPDNIRFLKDVERWIDKPITVLKSSKYKDIFDVFRKTGWLVGPGGARCTLEMKKKVRKDYQKEGDVHIFGLTSDEMKRVDRFETENSGVELEWVLIEANISKDDCYRIIQQAGIRLPEMYHLGYNNNNNCIGCVKGCSGYWNKIRVDFPEHFDRMAKLEREMNVAINKSYVGGKRRKVFLDELDPKVGHNVPMPDIECGVLCVSPDNDQPNISRFEPAF